MNPSLSLLRFVAAFLWADAHVAASEVAFFDALARELGVPHASALLALPPLPEEVDPTRVPPSLARRVRDACLLAIASDGEVHAREMELFDLLDELLPDDQTPS